MSLSDYELALRLQMQEDEKTASPKNDNTHKKPAKNISIIDSEWETIDPTPDIHGMFVEFNKRYFWNKLGACEVSWSQRMTLCAGLCRYEGRGRLCSIKLSVPLLKLRPRKDLVETLLHEMIHAYLFVTENNRDREGHGPEFQSHMRRINQETGTNITIYHSFHNEVELYRQHWWRCDGPCKDRKPFFGYVKRAMNRAPAPRDPWWNDHKASCNGTFHKVKEPENYSKKKESKNALLGKAQPTISSLFKKNDKKKTVPSPSKNSVPSNDAIGENAQKKSPIAAFKGKGRKLTDDSRHIDVKRRRIPGLFDPEEDKELNEINSVFDSDSDDDSLDRILEERRKQIDNKMKLKENKKQSKETLKRKSDDEIKNSKRPCIWLDEEASTSENLYSSFGSVSVTDNSPFTCDCPACGMKIIETYINQHLDECLKMT
ncbi:DgyrCDS8535 [Dimorphilus gyrociliatus]|uniref:Protein with SprT-like domain at the N terminus n=1 Tax=Dimorphilus gyrociliatus TaxID=2664684 RepID=A0A7I8VZK8_9ANNE|nr:DgyrCDS8535 [Dimorphilus gyrociliatus]